MEKKPRVPAYKSGDLVQFEYDGDFKKKVKRIICIATIHIEEGKEEWDGWYKGHLFYDERGYMEDHHVYRLEYFNSSGNLNVAEGRTLIARIGED